MSLVKVALRKMRSGIMAYGPSSLKRRLWDREYSIDKWNFAYDSKGDCVYQHLEKYAAGGSLLDLGGGIRRTATRWSTKRCHGCDGVSAANVCRRNAAVRST